MIEFVAPLAVGALGLIPKMVKKNERAKIEQVFKNLNFAVKENGNPKYPHFLKKQDTEFMRRYDYKLPLGLVIPDKLQHILSKTLNTPVEVGGENVMSIWVYKRNLPTKWSYNDLPDKEGWVTPIGKSYRGMVWHDFEKIPHMTVAGTTRFGKTVMLKNMLTYVASHHEEHSQFYIIDLKGGLEFGRYEQIKQVEGISSNGDEALKMLESIADRMNEDMQYFRNNFISNVVNSDIDRRVFIVVDEAAQLTPSKFMTTSEKKALEKCQAILSEIARIGGGLGYRLIYATQYPTADTLPRQIKMNADAKVSFRLPTGYASEVALDEQGAEKLEHKGRCIYKTHECVTVQAPLLEDNDMWKRLEVYSVDKAHAEDGEGTEDIIQFR